MNASNYNQAHLEAWKYGKKDTLKSAHIRY